MPMPIISKPKPCADKDLQNLLIFKVSPNLCQCTKKSVTVETTAQNLKQLNSLIRKVFFA
jgi:hypothetical protein